MVLDHLSPADSLRVIRSVVPEDVLPASLADTIVSHAGGVPFFLEELARAVAEHPDLRSEFEVPDTIQGVVSARLDRLPSDERSVLQAASVIGKDVDLAVLTEVAGLPDAELGRCLGHLQAAEFLHETLTVSTRQYTFKHALTQDVVYRALPEDARRNLHLRVAESIERVMPEVGARQPELLADHYTAGGRIAEAVGYWHRAGQHALQRSANVEAVAHLDKGLGLIARLPESPERGQQELALQMAISRALVMTRGFGAPEVGRALARARELCRPMGQEPALFPVLHGLWLFYIGRADFAAAEELAGQLLTVADRQSSDRLRVPAHVALGVPLFYRGEFAEALVHVGKAVALYDVADSPRQRATFGQDQGVGALGFTAWASALLGRCDEAAVFADRAIRLAREVDHPFSLALALHLASLVRMLRGEAALVGMQGEEQLALSREHRFPFFVAGALGFVGWSLVQAGQRERGLEMMRQGARAYRATGAEVGLSHLAHLADTLVEAGEIDEALAIASDGLAIAERTGEGVPLAELHRVRGEALLRSVAGGPAAAEASFHSALAVARRQHARLLELRAAISLARLRQAQGRLEEARELLAPLHGSFSEGAECADLKAASSFLDHLQ
jgi:predicted ATPase